MEYTMLNDALISRLIEICFCKLVRQSQIVQSVMQDYQYDLSHLPPVCNLLVQGPNNLQLLFVKTVRVTVVIYVEFRSF